MRHTFVRPAGESDTKQFIDWSMKTKNNLFDPTVKLALVACAYNQDRVVLYAPVQRPMFMEALAINPEASELEVAAALKAVIQFLVSQAHITGASEVYFYCADERTAEYAKRQLFEEVPFRLFRIKLSDLEKPKCESTPELS
jgi:hypothetical protein